VLKAGYPPASNDLAHRVKIHNIALRAAAWLLDLERHDT